MTYVVIIILSVFYYTTYTLYTTLHEHYNDALTTVAYPHLILYVYYYSTITIYHYRVYSICALQLQYNYVAQPRITLYDYYNDTLSNYPARKARV
jgi:hypothetical protein